MAAPDLAAPFVEIHHALIGSTNDEARRLARDGAPHGTIVTAGAQNAGRGRLDRDWISPTGNLYASVILRLDMAPSRAGEIAFLAAVAVAECALSYAPVGTNIRVKWPNDVLADGEKLAGILLETELAGRGKLPWLVVGMGLNVASAPAETPYPATCLHRLGPTKPTVPDVLAALTRDLGAALDLWRDHGFEPIRRRWLDFAQGLGQPIEVRRGASIVCGRFEGIDRDGALLLVTEAGPQRITVGDVAFPGLSGAVIDRENGAAA